jgi:hypothetical protein
MAEKSNLVALIYADEVSAKEIVIEGSGCGDDDGIENEISD